MTGSSLLRRRALAWGLAAGLLLLPLLAMQISAEVRWDATDFAAFALLLVVTGAAFEVLLASTPRRSIRVAVGLALAAGFVLVWADGAAGVF